MKELYLFQKLEQLKKDLECEANFQLTADDDVYYSLNVTVLKYYQLFTTELKIRKDFNQEGLDEMFKLIIERIRRTANERCLN